MEARTQFYKIVRFFKRSNNRKTIRAKLTLAEAQEHCQDPETSSATAKGYVAYKRTRKYGPWFDSYQKQTRK